MATLDYESNENALLKKRIELLENEVTGLWENYSNISNSFQNMESNNISEENTNDSIPDEIDAFIQSEEEKSITETEDFARGKWSLSCKKDNRNTGWNVLGCNKKWRKRCDCSRFGTCSTKRGGSSDITFIFNQAIRGNFKAEIYLYLLRVTSGNLKNYVELNGNQGENISTTKRTTNIQSCSGGFCSYYFEGTFKVYITNNQTGDKKSWTITPTNVGNRGKKWFHCGQRIDFKFVLTEWP